MIALAFVLSGAAALVYQVAWQRILALHSGVGIYSVAMIVAAFLLGLGAGSHLGGGWSVHLDARRALRAFALLELAIGLFGAASGWIYYDALYGRAPWLYAPAWRAGLVHLLALLPPTLLMGMSLPFLVRATVREAATAGAVVGRLYALNLLGAAAGAMLTPWVLVRLLGMRGALLAAAAANVVAGLCALLARPAPAGDAPASDTPASEAPPPGPPPRVRPRAFALWAALYALSGFCALSLEILWFRVMDVALKATAFTFGTVLSLYLLGMALGTLAGLRVAPRIRDPLAGFLGAQCALLAWAAAALWLLVALPADLPGYAWLVDYWAAPRPFNLGGDWNPGALVALYLLLPFALFGPPTILMGLSFTLLQRAVHDDPRTSGRKVGLLQAANIAGCVAGSLVTGLVLLDAWGTTGALRALVAAGLVFAALGLALAAARRTFLLAGVAVAALVLLFPGARRFWLRLHATPPESEAMVEEDATGLAALVPGGGRWSLWVNGRTNSSLPFGGFHTLLGAVPALVHPEPREIAIVGLGSGDTAWAAGCRRTTSRVRVFEICAPQVALLRGLATRPGAPRALVAFLRDPRMQVALEDGRNALLREERAYDVIEMDALFPSSPFSGNLYSLEFYRLCARRLKPGGLMVSWAPKPRVADTFRAAFPHVVEMRGGQLLLGANEPIALDAAAVAARAEGESVAAYLGENNVRKALEAVAGARPMGPRPADDLNRDLFPRDELKAEEVAAGE
jgi:hypothetical protein